MGFSDAVKSVFSKYATFSGRASRSEYWYFCLFNLIVTFVLAFAGGAIEVPYLSAIWCLVVLIPSLAVLVRRLHDINKSGWWYFIGLIPLIGGIWLLILLCAKSDEGANNYGTLD